jgi:serine acetyltransferase
MALRAASPPSRDDLGPFAGLRSAGAAFVEMIGAIREDHAHTRRSQAKYSGKVSAAEALPGDLIRKIGFQIMTSYRFMRFLTKAGVPVAPMVASRMIRHLYGSDIHWEADFAPGVMIVHGMGLAVSPAARVGAGVILNQNVTLGMGTHPETRAIGAPTLERNVHVGAGATLIGPITIGEGSRIMPGCLVVRSVPANSIVEAPTPVVRPRVRARN